jgi:hypothetical protein
MIKTIHAITSYLLIALGAVHTALTPVFYGRLTPNAMWFAGAGLAMIFVGFLNVILSRGAGLDSLARWLVYVANLLTRGWSAAVASPRSTRSASASASSRAMIGG